MGWASGELVSHWRPIFSVTTPILLRSLTWASWGDYDKRQFEAQCQRERVTYPFGVTHINIKNLFALMLDLRKEVSLERALETLGLGFQGSPHCGRDDAYNIARVLNMLLCMNQKVHLKRAEGRLGK